MHLLSVRLVFFFFNDTATTEIYTLSLHDALPISVGLSQSGEQRPGLPVHFSRGPRRARQEDQRRDGDGGHAGARKRRDRKSTRLNSSHSQISYAVFCLKKKKISNHICVSCMHTPT